MAETDLNRRVCAALAGFAPVRVENPACPGTPDIAYVNGWIEDKKITFPKRENSVVKVKHFTQKQRSWLVRHHCAGGVCHVVLEDSRSGGVYIIRGDLAAQELGYRTRRELMGLCVENDGCALLTGWNGSKFRDFIILYQRRQPCPYGHDLRLS